MDKIKLSALGIPEAKESRSIQIGGATVEVKQVIPYEEMLDMIQYGIDFIINERPFISAPLKRIVKDFAILTFYTNFDTSAIKEATEMKTIYEEYDLVTRFEVMEKVKPLIDQKQLAFFDATLEETLISIMKYRNSAVGIVDALSDVAKQSAGNMQEALDILSDDEQNQKLVNLLHFAEQIQG